MAINGHRNYFPICTSKFIFLKGDFKHIETKYLIYSIESIRLNLLMQLSLMFLHISKYNANSSGVDLIES